MSEGGLRRDTERRRKGTERGGGGHWERRRTMSLWPEVHPLNRLMEQKDSQNETQTASNNGHVAVMLK